MTNIYSLLGDEDELEWKPIWGFPNYFINTNGEVLSQSNPNKPKIIGTEHKNGSGIYAPMTPCVSLSRDISLEKDYPLSHYNMFSKGQLKKNETVSNIKFYKHKLVMYHFRPLENHPEDIGITKEEWSVLPPRVIEIIKRSIQINHIDHNHGNCKLSNLEWVDSIENILAYNKSDKFKELHKSGAFGYGPKVKWDIIERGTSEKVNLRDRHSLKST